MQELDLEIKHSVFSSKTSILNITAQYIRLTDYKGISIQFDKSAIKDYRYGIKWVRGFEFTVGRVYQLFVKND